MTIPRDDQRRGDRIAKLLARAGIASRREIERMIEDGRVALDGKPIDTPATVLTSLDGITVDGNAVQAAEPTRLFLYHKPTGLLVTERDPRGRPTIYDRLPVDLPRVVPVGRLDLNTEGLLLLTTDGGLKRQLELPATGIERAYRARAYGPVTQAQLEELAHGIEIEGVRYGSIDANIERRTGANVWIELTLTEGKNREVRRVLEHLGLQISRLIRIRYGPFVLSDLPMGAIGEVRQHDLEEFRKDMRGKKGAPQWSVAVNSPLVSEAVQPRTSSPRSAPRPTAVAPKAAALRGRGAGRHTQAPTPAMREGRTVPAADDRGRLFGSSSEARGKAHAATRAHASDRPRAARAPGVASRPQVGRTADRSTRNPAAPSRSGGGDESRSPRPPTRPAGSSKPGVGKPGKGPAGGRGHPPRTPRGKR